MAYTSNPEESYDHTASIREDLTDEVAIASPVTAPLLFQLGRGAALGSTTAEWTADNIPAASTDVLGDSAAFGSTGSRSASPEGADAEFPDEQARQRLANYTNIVTRAADISDTQRTMNQAGITDEYSYKIWKKMLEVAQQFDYNLHWGTSDAGAVGGGADAGNARMLHSAAAWITYTGLGFENDGDVGNVTIAGQTVRCTGPDSRVGYSGTYYGSAATLTRATFHSAMLVPAWRRGMTIDGAVAFCGYSVKNLISEFALVYQEGSSPGNENPGIARNERTISAHEKAIVDSIDRYDSNYGSVFFNLDRHMSGSETQTYSTGQSPGTQILDVDECMLILETDFWKVRYLRGIGYTPLAKIGDASKGQVVLEGTLQASNPICGILGNNLVT